MRSHQIRADGVDLLLAHEPDNGQAQSLRDLIDRAVKRDAYIGKWWQRDERTRLGADVIGVGLLAGAAAVTGVVVASVWRRATRK